MPLPNSPYVVPIPLEGYHAGRLAIEQIYGYMVRNARRFGVLTTVNAWMFLMRENGGKLWITRPIDCLVTAPHTILQALYYISALASQFGDLVETDQYGNPAEIPLANSKHPHAAPLLSAAQVTSSQSPSLTFVYPLPFNVQYKLVPCDFSQGVLLEPWKLEHCCGGKSFRGVLKPENVEVIVKVWDKYKLSSRNRDEEADIYMHLQSLWRKEIPQLICSADIDFCYGIILEDVKVNPLSLGD